MNAFRAVKSKDASKNLVNNFRPPQPLNNRQIKTNIKANNGAVANCNIFFLFISAISAFMHNYA